MNGDAPQPKANPNAESYADVAKSGIQALAPADKGWMLAVVIIIIALQVNDYFSAQRLSVYLTATDERRNAMILKYMDIATEQQRRSQEVIKQLTDASIRDGERAGRAAVQAIDRAGQRDIFEDSKEK